MSRWSATADERSQEQHRRFYAAAVSTSTKSTTNKDAFLTFLNYILHIFLSPDDADVGVDSRKNLSRISLFWLKKKSSVAQEKPSLFFFLPRDTTPAQDMN